MVTKRKLRKVCRKIANDVADDFQRYCDGIFEKLLRELKDGN